MPFNPGKGLYMQMNKQLLCCYKLLNQNKPKYNINNIEIEIKYNLDIRKIHSERIIINYNIYRMQLVN